jgi:hypothetical protein
MEKEGDEMINQCCFGIVPDDREEPSAIFANLEEAISWGLAKYGADRFRIRRWTGVLAPRQAGISSM